MRSFIKTKLLPSNKLKKERLFYQKYFLFSSISHIEPHPSSPKPTLTTNKLLPKVQVETKKFVPPNLLNGSKTQEDDSSIFDSLYSSLQNRKFEETRNFLQEIFFNKKKLIKLSWISKALTVYFHNKIENTEEIFSLYCQMQKLISEKKNSQELYPLHYKFFSEILLVNGDIERSHKVIEEGFQKFGRKKAPILHAELQWRYFVEGKDSFKDEIDKKLVDKTFRMEAREIYLSISNLASRMGKAEDVDFIVGQLKDMGFKDVGFCHSALISQFSREKNGEKLRQRILSLMNTCAKQPTAVEKILSDLVKSFGDLQMKEEAKFLFNAILDMNSDCRRENRKEIGDLIFYTSLAKTFSYLREFEIFDHIFQVVKSKYTLDRIAASVFAHGYGTLFRMFDKAQEVVHLTLQHKVRLHPELVSLFKSVYAVNHQTEALLSWSEFKSHVPMSADQFTEQIVKLSKTEDAGKTIRKYHEMLLEGYEPTHEVFRAIILMYSRMNMFREAYGYFREMNKTYGIPACNSTVLAILSCCPMERMYGIWKNLDNKNLIESDARVLELMLFRSAVYDFPTAFHFFELMLHRGIRLRSTIYRHVVTAALVAGRVNTAEEIIRHLSHNHAKILSEDDGYYLWVDFYLKNQDKVDDLLKSLSTEQANDVLSNNFHFFVHLYSNCADFERLFKTIDSFDIYGVKMRENDVLKILNSISEYGDDDILEQFISRLKKPLSENSSVLSAISRVYLQFDLFQLANLVVDLSDCRKLGNNLLTSLLEYYIRNNQKESFEKICEQIFQNNLLSVDLANLMMQKYQKEGKVSSAEKVFEHLFHMGLKPDDTSFSIMFDMISEHDTPRVVSLTNRLVECSVLVNNKSTPLVKAITKHLLNEESRNKMWQAVLSYKSTHPFHVADIRFLFSCVDVKMQRMEKRQKSIFDRNPFY